MVTKKSSNKKTSKSSEVTMDDLLAKYGDKVKGFSVGQRVEGKVVSKSNKKLVMDIGGKSEGVVAEKAYKEAENFIKSLEIGEEVEATVIVAETREGYTLLSLRHTSEDATWTKLEKAMKNVKPVTVLGRGVNTSGVMVEYGGFSGFVPNSQLGKEVSKNLQDLIGRRFEVVPIDVVRGENKAVFSEKLVSEADEMEAIRDAMKKLKVGASYKGKVTSIYDFGAFVEIQAEVKKGEKVPVEGLVHISELSWDKVGKPKEVVSEGDSVQVSVLGVEGGKLSLSMKQSQDDPWEEVEKKYKKDTKVNGEVTKISNFGVFVQLEPGVEGLLHITKIPPDKKFKEGDKAGVVIEEVDVRSRKISLGLVLTAKPIGYK